MVVLLSKFYPDSFKSIHLRWLLSGVILFVLTSCHKTEDAVGGSLKLSFSAKYGSLPFNGLQAYDYAGKQSIKFSKFDFYITGIQLISPTGTLTVDQRGLIDLTSSTTGANVVTLSNVKSGEYTAIKFNVGVSPDLNKKLPKDFPSDDALSSTSHYWDAWNSYIFSKMEGVLDTSGLRSYDLGFAIHTGTDQCLQTINLQKNFIIASNAVTNLNLDLNVKFVFTPAGQYFDLIKNPLNHNPTNIEILKSFSERLAGTIQINN